MLQLRNISKYYMYGKNKKMVLNGVSIDFKREELVFILGASGSGKSTLLNIIAGNKRCDSGEILLDGEDISKRNDKYLDNYRGSMIGYVYQDYNLIEYLSVYDNVMLGCTKKVDKRRVTLLLKQLGISDKRHIIVSKLSGGEKQRVAIARAMIKDPAIILCDEPTGAVDSVNSRNIIQILKIISEKRLVIVVSHDEDLAMDYGDRIIRIKDGHVNYQKINDNKLIGNVRENKVRKRSLLLMAIKNLGMKLGRTIWSSLALSLGIISMSLVICLGNNFNKEINSLEKKIVGLFPISIINEEIDIQDTTKNTSNKIIIKNNNYKHINKIDNNYLEYLKNIKEINYIRYSYDVLIPFISDRYKLLDNNYLEMIPDSEFIIDNYDIIYGNNINNKFDILIKIDSNNSVDRELLNYFNIVSDISYNDIIGRKIKVILNDSYYQENNGYYYINTNNKEMYNDSLIELKIVGVVKEKESIDNNSKIIYSSELFAMIINKNMDSNIINSQKVNSYNVLGINKNKEEMLNYLGYKSRPTGVFIYVDNLNNKKIVINKLDDYNKKMGDKYLKYSDTFEDMLKIVRDFIKIITVVLLVFSIISIIISLIMVGILTNVRILERRKEIGILRGLGFSKRNIRWLFNMENRIIVIFSSVIGIFVLKGLETPVNKIMYKVMEVDNIFIIDYFYVLEIVIINLLLVRLISFIPLRRASNMEITKCIYNR